MAFILPDLQTLLKVHDTQRHVAEVIGCSQSWVHSILKGRVRHVSVATAQKIAEAVRGDRGLDAEWRREAQKREMDEARRVREKGRNRGGQLGRRKIEHSDHVCTHCGAKADTAHALWMHSRAIHKDQPSQGKNQWAAFRRRA